MRGRTFPALVLATLLLFAIAMPAHAAPGDSVWSDTIAGDGSTQDWAFDVEVSGDGTKVFATGWARRTGHGQDYLTVAYDATSGATLWTRWYDGPVHHQDQAASLAVTANRVIVTGTSDGGGAAGDDIVTVAYDVETGQRRWVNRYDSPSHSEEFGASVDAGGGRAYAVGSAEGKLTLVTMRLTTGATVRVYRTKKSGQASDVVATGTRAYVAGYTITSGRSDAWYGGFDRSGARLWSGWFASVDPLENDYGEQLALTADRSRLYLAATAGSSMALLAVDPTNGQEEWSEVVTPQANGQDYAGGVAVAPDGSAVFITGEGEDEFYDPTYVTAAYDSDGNDLWTSREQDASDEGGAQAIGVSADGSDVYVTGYGRNTVPAFTGVLTIAYDASTGAPSSWEHLTQGTDFAGSGGAAIDVSPTGGVFVAGRLNDDFFVEAYEA